MGSYALLLAAEVFCVALAVAHARALTRLFGRNLRELVARVSRATGDDKLAQLRGHPSDNEGVVAQLADAGVEADPDARAAEIDAVLGDVNRRLMEKERWAPTALRVAIVLGCVHAFWAQGVIGAVGLVTGLVVGGVVGGVVAHIRRTEREGRADVDALVAALWGRASTVRGGHVGRAGGPRRGPVSSTRTFRVAYRELSAGSAVGPSIDPEPAGMGSENSSS